MAGNYIINITILDAKTGERLFQFKNGNLVAGVLAAANFVERKLGIKIRKWRQDDVKKH